MSRLSPARTPTRTRTSASAARRAASAEVLLRGPLLRPLLEPLSPPKAVGTQNRVSTAAYLSEADPDGPSLDEMRAAIVSNYSPPSSPPKTTLDGFVKPQKQEIRDAAASDLSQADPTGPSLAEMRAVIVGSFSPPSSPLKLDMCDPPPKETLRNAAATDLSQADPDGPSLAEMREVIESRKLLARAEHDAAMTSCGPVHSNLPWYTRMVRPVARCMLVTLLEARGRKLEPMSARSTAAARSMPVVHTTPAQQRSAATIQRAWRSNDRQDAWRRSFYQPVERCVHACTGLSLHHLGVFLLEYARDAPSARRAFARGAAVGDVRSQRSLGLLAYVGLGGGIDLPLARMMFADAAARGDGISHNNLAVMLAHGLGGPRDEARAREHLLDAAAVAEEESANASESMPPLGLRNVALMHFTGEPSEDPPPSPIGSPSAEAATMPRRADDEHGDDDALPPLVDYHTARRYFSLCAPYGDAVAEYYLGYMTDHGKGGGVDEAQARVWYTLAASHVPGRTKRRGAHQWASARDDDDEDEGDEGNAATGSGVGSWLGEDGEDEWDWGIGEAPPSADELMCKGNVMRRTRTAVDACYLALSRDDAADVRAAVLEARARLGEMCYAGRGGPRNTAQARVWLQSAASKGHALAQLSLANMLRLGEGGPVDAERARDLYFLCAAQVCSRSLSLSLVCPLAETCVLRVQGNVAAMEHAAAMLRYGEGGEADEELARLYYEHAASNGSHQAMLSLGNLALEGGGGEGEDGEDDEEEDDEEGGGARGGAPASVDPAADAVAWFEASAGRGDLVAQVNLGLMYLNGEHGVARDLAKAKQWLSLAAQNGDVNAAYLLAMAILESEGERSKRRVRMLLTRAAAAGHAEAQRQLGLMLWHDEKCGSADDKLQRRQGAQWLAKAAAQGAASDYWATPAVNHPMWNPPPRMPTVAKAAKAATGRITNYRAEKARQAVATLAGQKAAGRAGMRAKAEDKVYLGEAMQHATKAALDAAAAEANKERTQRAREEAARLEMERQRRVSPYAALMAERAAVAEAEKERLREKERRAAALSATTASAVSRDSEADEIMSSAAALAGAEGAQPEADGADGQVDVHAPASQDAARLEGLPASAPTALLPLVSDAAPAEAPAAATGEEDGLQPYAQGLEYDGATNGTVEAPAPGPAAVMVESPSA